MRVQVRKLLQAAVIAMSLLGAATASGLVVRANDTDEITWQFEIQVSFTSDQINQPGWEENTRAMESALTARLQSDGTRLQATRAAKAGGAEFTFHAAGKGTVAQFKRVAFDDLSPVGGLIGGTTALTLNGAVKRGENLSVVLESNPSTGYAWNVSQMDTAVLKSAGTTQFQQKANKPGAPAKQTIKLNAAQDSNATLALIYRRPWDTAEPTRRVTVSAARLTALLNVTNPLTPTATQTTAPNLPVRAPEGAAALPSHFNWASTDNTAGAIRVTPIRDQGSCGSCWAFATVAPFESNILIKEGVSTNLSEQFLVSCDTEQDGCSGGWWAHNYHYNAVAAGDTVAGAVYESAFPYVAYDATCHTPYNHPYRLNNWYSLGTYPTVSAIKNAIYNYGPVSAALCAGSHFQSYRGGVFTDTDGSDCYYYGVNHAVTLVGWDDSTSTWVLRNSWGTYWGESAYSGGEQGYMRIVYGTSYVGYNATYVVYNGSVPCYSLTNSASPSGSGGVLASPAPNCSTDSTQYTQNTDVSVTAMPGCGRTFLSWSGALSGSANPAKITMSAHRSITANFSASSSPCYLQLPFVIKNFP